MNKEHPILFSVEMVQAILEGRKTQTRRVVKPQPPARTGSIVGLSEFNVCGHNYRCPYGEISSRLWVREAWCDRLPWAKEKCQDGPCYKSTDEGDCGFHITGQKWKSSMFMPHKYRRIILEITDIKVHRLQDITHKEALLEGVEYDTSKIDGSPLARFKKVWESINSKKEGYDWWSNPFVWVVTFKRID